MFHKKKKATNKLYADNVVVYKYHTDTGLLEIFPRCLIYEQLNILPKQYYARGVTRIIGPENFAIISKKPGEVFDRYFENDILFWLINRDDRKARRIIRSHITKRTDQIIENCIEMLKQGQELSDTVVRTFDGSIPENDISDQDLQYFLENYTYRISE